MTRLHYPPPKNFITKYQNPVSICAIVSGSLETSVPTETYNVVSLQIRPYENTEDCFTKDLVDEAQFEVLAAQFKDTDFNGAYYLNIPVMYVQTESLNIVSDNDYDAAHPAGIPLNDLCNVFYLCVDDILANSYRFTLTAQQKENKWSAGYFEKSITEFNREKPTLVAFDFRIQPIFRPAVPGTHRFTVTYKKYRRQRVERNYRTIEPCRESGLRELCLCQHNRDAPTSRSIPIVCSLVPSRRRKPIGQSVPDEPVFDKFRAIPKTSSITESYLRKEQKLSGRLKAFSAIFTGEFEVVEPEGGLGRRSGCGGFRRRGCPC